MRAVRKDFDMSTSFKPADVAKAPSFEAPKPAVSAVPPIPTPTAQNDNPQQPQQPKKEGANMAEVSGANFAQQMVVDTVFPGLGLIMGAMNNAEFAASAVDLHNESKTPANKPAQDVAVATNRTQQAAFKPALEQNDFSTRSFGMGKNNNIQINFTRPSDTDGQLSKTRGLDLAAPMRKLASPFQAPTMGR